MAALRSRMRDRFCLYVAQGFNYTRAAKEAGFAVPKNMGARLMAVPEVRARVEELDKAAEGARIREVTRVVVPTREYVIKGLIDNVEAAKEAGDRGSGEQGTGANRQGNRDVRAAEHADRQPFATTAR